MQDQIRQMANDLRNAEHWYYDEISCTAELDEQKTAKNLYDAGYRKQSEMEWLPNPGGGWLCGNCKKYSSGLRNFCPECGAKMKGD